MFVEPRPHLRGLQPVSHGSVSDAELAALGLSANDVLDFSVNTNPFGPSPRVLEALQQVDVARYPDPDTIALRETLARQLGVPAQHILAGNGSVELLWLAALAYLGPGDSALVLGPTFGEYQRAVSINGGCVRELRADAERDFAPDLKQVEAALSGGAIRLAFICNPNNPTGVYMPPKLLYRLAEGFRRTLFVVDEAYLTLMPESDSCLGANMPDNLLVLRSLTKDMALPSLRLGYTVAAPQVLAPLKAVQPPWSVNALAQAAGVAALEDAEHLRRSVQGIVEAKAYLEEALRGLGYRVHPSAANFLLMEVDDAPAFRAALLRRGCCLRDCTSFGLPQYVRIGVRTLPECRRLVQAMAELARTIEL